MTFFNPPKKHAPHVCRPPEPTALQPQGWRCECGKAYVKRSQSQHGETWTDWQRSPENDASESDEQAGGDRG